MKIIDFFKTRLLHLGRLFFPFNSIEKILYGTQIRADVLNWLLERYYRSKFHRDWKNNNLPNFEDNRCFLNLWYVNGTRWPFGRNPDFLTRGFLNREIMSTGMNVLDIGCGDGFFDYLFYSGVVNHIDAIDVDQSAISLARKYHKALNINYIIQDCVMQNFPKDAYDVVVWDGAIGHFTQNDIDIVMKKIEQVLGENGVLVGSEELTSIEAKSWNHHLAFPELIDLKTFLSSYFPKVLVKEIPSIRGRYREGYFRCGYDLKNMSKNSWS